MNHLVIDLEMCEVPRNYRSEKYKYANEIIQIGAVLLDETFQRIDTYNQFVCPEHGVINNYITNLTGIRQKQVKKAPKLQNVLQNMLKWVGNRSYKVYAWSDNDYIQLCHEINNKKIEGECIAEFMNPSRWIDYQKVFSKRYQFDRNIGLEETLMLCEVDVQGRMHDGLFDAINTAEIIRILETDACFQLINYTQEGGRESKALNFCLGDLLSGLQLQCA